MSTHNIRKQLRIVMENVGLKSRGDAYAKSKRATARHSKKDPERRLFIRRLRRANYKSGKRNPRTQESL